MTALRVAAQPDRDTSLRPVPWRRMAWVTWRQHRTTLISLLAVFGVLAVFLWLAGLKIHHNYAALTACRPFTSITCQALNTTFNHTDWTLANILGILMQFVPALIGAFAGAPVLARELESGTFRYAWTQGFGRARFAIAKLVLLAIAVTVVAWAFSEVFSWFFRPFLAQEDLTVLSATVFDTRGVALAAWTLTAFAIGVLLGMLLRRIVPAMAVTLGGYLGLSLAAWWLRGHYPVALVTSNPSVSGNGPITSTDPWVLSTWYTGPGGQPANPAVVNHVLALFPHNGPPLVKETVAQAFAQHGITQWWRYIPVSRFWPMQFIEAGWLLVLSVLLLAGTVWLVRRRAA